MGHPRPSHQWDMHRRSLFLPTPPWAREDNISPRVLHKHLLFRKQATWARAWVGQGQDSYPGTSGTQGLVYAITPQTELSYQSVIQGTFLLFRLWARVLFDSGASRSCIDASCVKDLGLEVETLEETLHVSSSLGTRVRVDQICRDCELEISGILLIMDLRVMDMSEFDVILGMD